ncbi:MAG: choice-of-anchor D domain-containing protein [Calditrichaeota bacterium]|nr:choice-of-anchor D domain-containing protein [Calditrichota bacterium]MCB9365729.1 choice-of-anchor D domain-containing protein [Calditrichota bacterium]
MLRLSSILFFLSCALGQTLPPDSVWTFSWDDGGDEFFYDAVEVSDGFILCGEAREWNAQTGDALLVKIDREGELVWHHRLPAEVGRRLTDIPRAGLAYGERTNASGQGEQFFVVAYDSTGVLLDDWTWEYSPEPLRLLEYGEANTIYREGDEGYEMVYARRLDGEGDNSIRRFTCCGFVTSTTITSGPGDLANAQDTYFDFAICGETLNAGVSGRDGLLTWRRYPADSVNQFHRAEIGGAGDDWFSDIVGGELPRAYTMCGGTYSSTRGGSDLWIVTCNESGDVIIENSFGGLSYEDGVAILPASDNGYLVAGNYSSEDINFEQSDFWLLKVDQNGDSVWSVVAGGEEADRCDGMLRTENGFLLYGSTQSFTVPGWDACAMFLGYVPDLAAAPSSLNFGPVVVGDSVTRSLNLINTGSNTLTVEEIQGSESYSASFSGPATIALGETLSVTVVFAPQSAGNHVDTLRVISDAISGEKLVRCLGAGLAQDANDESLLPREFALHPPYPNPFNPSTTIAVDLPKSSEVELTIFDVQGRLVERLVDGELSAGTHTRVWNCSTCSGGVYFVRLRTSDYEGIQKMVLIK